MTSIPGRARRLAPDERRAALVDATLPLVLQHGAAVSTRQIAQAAGVAEGTIFRVFPDKDALVRAAVGAALDPGPLLRALADVERDRPLRDRLVAAVAILQERLARVSVLFDALPSRCDRSQHHPRVLHQAVTEAIVDVVGADAHRLRVPAADLANLLRLFAFTTTRLRNGDPLTAEQVVDVLLDGALTRSDPTEDGQC